MNVIWSSNWCDAFILLNSDDLIIITNITREKFEPLLEKFVLSLLSRIKIIDNEARHCQETQHITALCEIESSAEIELSLLHLLKRHKLRRPSQTTETVSLASEILSLHFPRANQRTTGLQDTDTGRNSSRCSPTGRLKRD